ncbi:ubiquinone/menaquinone biosynthesis methyltransferase [Anaeromyxobacter oryzae]|uniref:Demethylmenaquinone methyltransferase n=1 Tax=Anaeromyxobacter oryzae TaxID=2918170 RepID=A0ABM7WUM5_9BACT|nr:ubiquinone/menaquinone biosynthesis methyltransferase [Anaeromyxobacter oryzae]BDG03098.1 demethylmenaquinone methyltransferase [Anaeromyxobacter oryzae]
MSVPLPGEGPRAGQVRAMFDRVAPSYDLLNRVMSLRIDQAWRSRLLRELAPKQGEAMLDLCAGTMDVAAMARRRVPGLTIVGADFSFGMLSRGVRKTGLPAAQADALALPFQSRSFDLATVTFGMRNLDSWEAGLRELARALRPGARLGILEFFRPETAGTRVVHVAINKVMVPVMGRILSPDPAAYRYLVASMERFASRPEFEEGARRNGFRDVRGETLFPGMCGLVTAVRA